jgi:hypothetical protein
MRLAAIVLSDPAKKKDRTVGHFPCGLKNAAWEVFDPIDTPHGQYNGKPPFAYVNKITLQKNYRKQGRFSCPSEAIDRFSGFW